MCTVCPSPFEALSQINTLAIVDFLANTEVPDFVTVVKYHHLLINILMIMTLRNLIKCCLLLNTVVLRLNFRWIIKVNERYIII